MGWRRYILSLAVAFALPQPLALALPEKHYQEQWCAEHEGKSEVVLSDGTRADCETRSHIIEVEFSRKWYEAVGQSLYYSLQTGKKAGIVLIIGPDDRKYWIRMNSTIRHFNLPIDTWKVER